MKPRLNDIVAATAAAIRQQYTKAELLGEARNKALVRWRYASMRVARRLTGKSTLLIGLAHNRDHTTVIHGLRSNYDTLEHEAAIEAALIDVMAARRQRYEAMVNSFRERGVAP